MGERPPRKTREVLSFLRAAVWLVHQVSDVVPRIAKTMKGATVDLSTAANSAGMPWLLVFKLTMVVPQSKQTRSSGRLALRGMLPGALGFADCLSRSPAQWRMAKGNRFLVRGASE